jgi:hypothetical protein
MYIFRTETAGSQIKFSGSVPLVNMINDAQTWEDNIRINLREMR